jgi:hypothetical protein
MPPLIIRAGDELIITRRWENVNPALISAGLPIWCVPGIVRALDEL